MDFQNNNRFYATNTEHRQLSGLAMTNTFESRYQTKPDMKMIIGISAAVILSMLVLKTYKKR